MSWMAGRISGVRTKRKRHAGWSSIVHRLVTAPMSRVGDLRISANSTPLAMRSLTLLFLRASMAVTSLATTMSPNPTYWFCTGIISEPSRRLGATWIGSCPSTPGGWFSALKRNARREGWYTIG